MKPYLKTEKKSMKAQSKTGHSTTLLNVPLSRPKGEKLPKQICRNLRHMFSLIPCPI